MIKGIAIVGLNGGGKSTLAHALGKRLDYFELDVEDCYFPEQRESRNWALENDSLFETACFDILPFSNSRTKNEVEVIIAESIKNNPTFIISGVTMNWNDEILSCIDIIFWVQTPLEERLNRIQQREEKRFGSRVLDGGDMYAQQIEFRKMVENRNTKVIEDSIMKLNCPIIEIDGTLSVAYNLEIIIENLNTAYHQ